VSGAGAADGDSDVRLWRGREIPAGTTFRPPALVKVLNRAARKSQLVLTADGVAHVEPDGDVHHVRFADVVGVEVHGDARLLFGADGCMVAVDPSNDTLVPQRIMTPLFVKLAGEHGVGHGLVGIEA
jgi:hypothetical protein